MRNKSISGSTALLLILVSSLSISGQEREQTSMSAGLKSGVSVSVKTTTEPMGSFKSISGVITVNAKGIHRVLIDKVDHVFFGYDIELEPVNEAKQYKVSIKPLDRGFAEEIAQSGTMKEITGLSDASANDPSFLRFPEPQLVADGDTLALNLLINRRTGVKLVDLITIMSGDAIARSTPRDAGPASDFRVEDIRLTMKDHQLLINGELAAGGPNAPGSCEGEFIFFYLPGRGRFVFSIKPQEGFGFQKIAVIQHNRISFSVGADSYEWVSSAPILGAGGNWNLWVLHEPNYQPLYGVGSNDRFVFGAMDGVRALRNERE